MICLTILSNYEMPEAHKPNLYVVPLSSLLTIRSMSKRIVELKAMKERISWQWLLARSESLEMDIHIDEELTCSQDG